MLKHAVMEGVNAQKWATRERLHLIEEWMEGDRESTYLAIDATTNPPQEGPFWNLHLPYTPKHGNMTNRAACTVFNEAQKILGTDLPVRHVPIKANGIAPAILRGMAWGMARGVRVFSSSHHSIDRMDPGLEGIASFCIRNDVVFVTSKHGGETDTAGHHIIKVGRGPQDDRPGVEFIRDERTASHAIATIGAKIAAAWCLVPNLSVNELFTRVIVPSAVPTPAYPKIQYGRIDLPRAIETARRLEP